MNNAKKDYGEIIIEKRKICSSWWGQMWCKNIEKYSGLKNRLERGRTYIRNNTIKKFVISNNQIDAYVQGSQYEPYIVKINIKTIEKSKYNNIVKRCEKSIDDFETLINGTFPKEFQELFTDEIYGLFPSAKEISYKCTCLDYYNALHNFKNDKHMCKHIAATLYGVGNKLDVDPLIFFKLRGIDLNNFSKILIKKENNYVWKNVNSNTDRQVSEDDISKMFGIEYSDDFKNMEVNNILDISEINYSTKESEINSQLVENDNHDEHNDSNEDSYDLNFEEWLNIFKTQSSILNDKIESSDIEQPNDYSHNNKFNPFENNIIENNKVIQEGTINEQEKSNLKNNSYSIQIFGNVNNDTEKIQQNNNENVMNNNLNIKIKKEGLLKRIFNKLKK